GAPRPPGAPPPGAPGGPPGPPRPPGAPAGPPRPGMAPPMPPVVEAVTPSVGHISGGTTMLITGQKFVPGVQVLFGDKPMEHVVVRAGIRRRGKAPAGAAATVDLKVTNPDGLNVAVPAAFTYVTGPAVAKVEPNMGSIEGVAITIIGENFDKEAKVEVG